MKKHINKYEHKKEQEGNQFLGFQPEDKIDFHEFGLLTNYDIEKRLNEFIEDSYYLGLENILVITGKGQVVRPLVEKLLKINKYVKIFRSAGYYNGQQGAFEVVVRNE